MGVLGGGKTQLDFGEEWEKHPEKRSPPLPNGTSLRWGGGGGGEILIN